MGKDNVIFLEVIEWFDETGKELVHRIPEKGSGRSSTARSSRSGKSQAGVFFYKAKPSKLLAPGGTR